MSTVSRLALAALCALPVSTAFAADNTTPANGEFRFTAPLWSYISFPNGVSENLITKGKENKKELQSRNLYVPVVKVDSTDNTKNQKILYIRTVDVGSPDDQCPDKTKSCIIISGKESEIDKIPHRITSVGFGFATTPLKYYTSGKTKSASNVNAFATFGGTTEILNMYQTSVTGSGFVFFGATGITAQKQSDPKTSDSLLGVSAGIGLDFGVGSPNFQANDRIGAGILLGKDMAFNAGGYEYNSKPWLGLMLSYRVHY